MVGCCENGNEPSGFVQRGEDQNPGELLASPGELRCGVHGTSFTSSAYPVKERAERWLAASRMLSRAVY